MKKLIFTLLASCFVMIGLAGPNGYYNAYGYTSHLGIKAVNHAPFTVVLNYNSYSPTTYFHQKNIAPGRHHIKILQQVEDPYTCQVFNKVMYDGYLDVPAKSKVAARWSKFQGLRVTHVTPLHHGNHYNNGGHYQNNNGNGYHNGNDPYNNDVDHYNNTDPYNNGNNGYNNNNGYQQQIAYGMNQQQFQNLKYAVKRANFDQDRLRIARQGIAANGVTAAQVEALMRVLSFESNRLKLAKFAYRHTVDQNNYYVVNNAFTFNSSIRQLNNYINNY